MSFLFAGILILSAWGEDLTVRAGQAPRVVAGGGHHPHVHNPDLAFDGPGLPKRLLLRRRAPRDAIA